MMTYEKPLAVYVSFETEAVMYGGTGEVAPGFSSVEEGIMDLDLGSL